MDGSKAVRDEGQEAFRLLSELLPLMETQEYICIHRGHGERREEKGNSSAKWLREAVALRPYQWQGVRWLGWLRNMGLGGCLCDEMGLGKTLQVLGAMAIDSLERWGGQGRGQDRMEKGTEEEGGVAGLEEGTVLRQGTEGRNVACGEADRRMAAVSLVVCPASLVGHWEAEAQRWMRRGVLEVRTVSAGVGGLEKERLMLWATGAREGAEEGCVEGGGGEVRGMRIVVMSYEMLRREVGRLEDIHWEWLVLDECHVLRSGRARMLGKALRRLRARFRVGLTGTPLQNQVSDVWGIFDVLCPGLLRDRFVCLTI